MPNSPDSPTTSAVPVLLQGWCDLWGVGDLAPQISVEISSRMTRSLGRAYPDRKLIRIARFVSEESDELFQEVLCHEAAHVAARRIHGRSIRPHGPEWKRLIQAAGYPPSVRYRGAALPKMPARARRRRVKATYLERLQTALLRKLRALP